MIRTPRATSKDFDEARLVTKIVTLYYLKGLSQAEIAKQLGLSTSRVNRLFSYAHDHGIVQIKINSPLELTLDLETRLEAIFAIQEAVVVPAALDDNETLSEAVAAAAARYLETHLRDGDVVVSGGGTTMLRVVRHLDPPHSRHVTIVPYEGSFKSDDIATDINYLASEFAGKFKGKWLPLHAPAWVDTIDQRNTMIQMSEIKHVLDTGRNANVAVVSMGPVEPERQLVTAFYRYSPRDYDRIRNHYGGVGEISGHIYDNQGQPTAAEYTDHIIGLALAELKAIPCRIGVSATPHKATAIYAALKGGYFDVMVLDELVARAVLEQFDRDFHGSLGDQPAPHTT